MTHRGRMMIGKAMNGLVYSTESGRMCPACRQPVSGCRCGKPPALGASDGIARVSRETKGRAGKGVTVIRGLSLEPAALTELARQLKTACRSGGTVKDGAIELQGDHRDTVIASLARIGLAARRSGG
jgi:translation initiation factor 1